MANLAGLTIYSLSVRMVITHCSWSVYRSLGRCKSSWTWDSQTQGQGTDSQGSQTRNTLLGGWRSAMSTGSMPCSLSCCLTRPAWCCRLDFQRLRRIARWGAVGASRVAPPQAAEVRRMVAAKGAGSGEAAWAPRPAASPWLREPRVTHAALQDYRASMHDLPHVHEAEADWDAEPSSPSEAAPK